MDIWRTGIARAPIAEILERGGIGGLPIQWLPHDRRSFTFLADPFGLAADGKIHVFVEAFDYRERRGRIDVLTFDETLSSSTGPSAFRSRGTSPTPACFKTIRIFTCCQRRIVQGR